MQAGLRVPSRLDREGVSKTVRFLQEFCDLDQDAALRLVSLTGDVRTCQVVNPARAIRIEIPGAVLRSWG